MDEYISRETLLAEIAADYGNWIAYNDTDESYRQGVDDNYNDTIRLINDIPAADVQPVKNGYWIEYERLIGIFGTLCDHMVDNGRCDVFCPYAKTKDEDDECEAWRTIQKFRREDGDSDG